MIEIKEIRFAESNGDKWLICREESEGQEK